MPSAAGIVGVVDDAGDAGVDAAECRHQVADIHILRPVGLGKGQVRRRRVGGECRRIRIDAAQLALPGMPVRIDKARNDDHVRRIDDRGLRRRNVGCHRGNALACNQHIPLCEVADLPVEADNGTALEQDAPVGIGIRPRHLLERAGIEGRASRGIDSREKWNRGRESGTGSEHVAPRWCVKGSSGHGCLLGDAIRGVSYSAADALRAVRPITADIPPWDVPS